VQPDENEAEASRPEALAPLHPSQIHVLRINMLIVAAFVLLGAFVLDISPLRESAIPQGPVPALVAALGLAAILILPGRRYRAWGYRESEDELDIRHGLLIRRRTIVSFGRIQHIDVAQGPVQRRFGLATLILHTAGTRGAAVPLPGLPHAEAEAMRDRIRAKIRQDLV